ncbi:hypothetical protein [Paraglaciecola polaris]|uniref:Pyridine nucleotide transhydrogenase n=1 Tax=Paraglaciecola polaris LMG 21857 TaxID=1129793 RepID=K6YQ26_9ALTE|nr:hypothetical protein [Paraglaciecola polaris]GAC34809.1 hypothetical protein GPLA_3930 [Paraglaciecola polaris LMG 21857]|tara:strand:- start:101 stop:427 length:327 start_codon:yes stop_codon:yes gene_type:complete
MLRIKLPIIVAMLSVFSSAASHAETQNNRLFDCMESSTFAIDGSCMANKIQQNVQFREMQLNIAQKTQVQDANAVATMQFFENEMRINVIAHKDALDESELLVRNAAE